MSYFGLGADLRLDVQIDASGEFHSHIYCKEIMQALKAANLPTHIQKCISYNHNGYILQRRECRSFIPIYLPN